MRKEMKSVSIKTVRIPADTHKEIKMFLAKNGGSMMAFLGYAAEDRLKKMGWINKK